VLFVFKIFKMAANLKIKLSKISKEILKFWNFIWNFWKILNFEKF
jgi:hypothetical protein